MFVKGQRTCSHKGWNHSMRYGEILVKEVEVFQNFQSQQQIPTH